MASLHPPSVTKQTWCQKTLSKNVETFLRAPQGGQARSSPFGGRY